MQLLPAGPNWVPDKSGTISGFLRVSPYYPLTYAPASHSRATTIMREVNASDSRAQVREKYADGSIPPFEEQTGTNEGAKGRLPVIL